MKRQIPGLYREGRNGDDILEGVFLVRVERTFYRWHPQRPFYVVRFGILEPREHQGHFLTGRLYCTPKALWKLSWFLRDFGYDPDLIQYLKASISDQQRRDFGQLVAATSSQIEAGQFIPHSGIRFPQNGCVSCAQLGLCLDNQQLVEQKLIRRPGASDLDWLDHLDD